MKCVAKRITALAAVAVLFTSFTVDAAFARWVTKRYADGTVRRVWVDDGLPGLNWGHKFPGNPYRPGQQTKSDVSRLQMKTPLNPVGDDFSKARRKRARRRFPAGAALPSRSVLRIARG